eukprot:3931096-Pyramimonas_sp.AAC.5
MTVAVCAVYVPLRLRVWGRWDVDRINENPDDEEGSTKGAAQWGKRKRGLGGQARVYTHALAGGEAQAHVPSQVLRLAEYLTDLVYGSSKTLTG